MSYEVNYSGEIRIDPPIYADDVAAAGFCESGRYGDKDVALKVVEEPVESVPGAYRRLAVAIVPCMSYYTAYRMEDHIQEVVTRWGDGRTFTGWIQGSDPHDTSGDQWRFMVRDGAVVTVKPRIVWPDEESN